MELKFPNGNGYFCTIGLKSLSWDSQKELLRLFVKTTTLSKCKRNNIKDFHTTEQNYTCKPSEPFCILFIFAIIFSLFLPQKYVLYKYSTYCTSHSIKLEKEIRKIKKCGALFLLWVGGKNSAEVLIASSLKHFDVGFVCCSNRGHSNTFVSC
jgi:hypothetical protein